MFLGNFHFIFLSYFISDGTKGDKDDFFYDAEAVDMAAAFLGPTLWDRTLPSDSDLKLEYMDIDEFLAENGIQVNNSESKEDKSARDIPPTIERPMTPTDELIAQPYSNVSMPSSPVISPVMVDTQSTHSMDGVGATPLGSPSKEHFYL